MISRWNAGPFYIEAAPFRATRKIIVGTATSRDQAHTLLEDIARAQHRSVIHYRINRRRRR